MQLDLKRMPFGRRLSRHMVYEETDNLGAGWTRGLYLALAADGGGSFIGGPVIGPKGFLRVTPVCDGRPVDYSYTASPFLVGLTTEKGGVRFALDGGKVLRIEGKGLGLRLDGKLGFGSNAVTTHRGIEILQGGSVYLIRTLRGKAMLDCRWELKALRCTDPVVTIEPDDEGFFDIVVYDTDDAYELPETAASLDSAAAESEADFRFFTAGLTESGTGNAEFLDLVAYTLWMSFLPFRGKELACSNKMSDHKFYAAEQPILAMPFKSVARALEMIGAMLDFASPLGLVPTWSAERQNLYEAVSPVYAVAVSRLISGGEMNGVSREQLSGFYALMSKAVNWWLNKRSNDAGLVFYAYRHECAWQDEAVFSCGAPSAAPDLAAYITLAAEALSKIAAQLGSSDEAALWNELKVKQLDILTKTLWDKDGFKCVNAFTEETGPAGGVPGLMPLILGKRLPDEISGALIEKAKGLQWADTAVIPAALIIMGLKDLGRDNEADAAAAELMASCVAGGANDARGKGTASGAFYASAACAALLALGGGTLQ